MCSPTIGEKAEHKQGEHKVRPYDCLVVSSPGRPFVSAQPTCLLPPRLGGEGQGEGV